MYIYICKHYCEEKYLIKNKQRVELIMSLTTTQTIFPEDLVENNSSVLPMLLLFDVITLKMARKPVQLQKKNLAGCAGEDKQSKEK